MKTLIVGLVLVSIFSAIGYIFWQTDLKYSQPTPVPAHYQPLDMGEEVSLEELALSTDRPTLLHFFNPHCPCSKFNFEHFRTLALSYGDKVDFKVVLQDLEEKDARVAFAGYDLQVPTLFDHDGKIAEACGVYATPQAVLLDKEGHIYFRGNYNKSRYCTVTGSNYTQMALDSLIAGKDIPYFGPLAYRAYGCQLPSDNPATALDFWDLSF
ncbi:TlpA family protein disulfide reductase [Roseivirga sp. BDSF3-8]|uniref:TlpA family protein disulfide reductase n=1 Tax=Roseivirga sp. BDSF3-8 TaxID=3241598 RepID=UPI003531E57A